METPATLKNPKTIKENLQGVTLLGKGKEIPTTELVEPSSSQDHPGVRRAACALIFPFPEISTRIAEVRRIRGRVLAPAEL